MESTKIGIENATLIADYIQNGQVTEIAKPGYIVEIMRFSKNMFEIVEYDARENNSNSTIYSRDDFIEKVSVFSFEYYNKLITKLNKNN